jgi:PIN domain nuclease of toxin-antitoxin system
MIILDTHIWIWWNQDSPRLTSFQKEIIDSSHTDGIGISTISLLEISRLVNRGRLVLPLPLNEWFSIALAEEGILLIPITPAIAIESYSQLIYDQLVRSHSTLFEVRSTSNKLK